MKKEGKCYLSGSIIFFIKLVIFSDGFSMSVNISRKENKFSLKFTVKC